MRTSLWGALLVQKQCSDCIKLEVELASKTECDRTKQANKHAHFHRNLLSIRRYMINSIPLFGLVSQASACAYKL